MNGRVIFSDDFSSKMNIVLGAKGYDKFFLLTDSKVDSIYHEKVKSLLDEYNLNFIVIPEGDQNKDLSSLSAIWKYLSDNGATRHSCLINFGGGMITDLGGFAASTFKRGIDFVNVPTTLLAIVDASSGGKTAINFNGLKNEVGAFALPSAVIIDKDFLRSLSNEDILSGYAEMLKHSLIDSEKMWSEIINYDIRDIATSQFEDMMKASVQLKECVVNEDPREKGIRKILNFGHTFGHAFEEMSYSSGHPLLHGYAVAFGMICELYLSTILLGFPTDRMRQTVRFIHDNYGTMPITCNDYDNLLALMQHDKKNTSGVINFALLQNFGKFAIDCHPTKDEIFESLDFLREGM